MHLYSVVLEFQPKFVFTTYAAAVQGSVNSPGKLAQKTVSMPYSMANMNNACIVAIDGRLMYSIRSRMASL